MPTIPFNHHAFLDKDSRSLNTTAIPSLNLASLRDLKLSKAWQLLEEEKKKSDDKKEHYGWQEWMDDGSKGIFLLLFFYKHIIHTRKDTRKLIIDSYECISCAHA